LQSLMFSSGPVMLPRLFVGHPRARNRGLVI
jgi:hypothetical protein